MITCDQEKLERKKAEYVEKMKNQIALIHKAAEEKRAMIEAKQGEDLLKAEEMAAKYQAKGTPPKKLLGIFWGAEWILSISRQQESLSGYWSVHVLAWSWGSIH